MASARSILLRINALRNSAVISRNPLNPCKVVSVFVEVLMGKTQGDN